MAWHGMALALQCMGAWDCTALQLRPISLLRLSLLRLLDPNSPETSPMDLGIPPLRLCLSPIGVQPSEIKNLSNYGDWPYFVAFGS